MAVLVMVVSAWAQGGKGEKPKGKPVPAAGKTAPAAKPAKGVEETKPAQADQPTSALATWIEDRSDQIHILAKVGAPGILLAACIGLYLFFRKPPEAKRHKGRWVHASVAVLFGLAAAAHAVAFDTNHFLADPRSEMLRSGTWLAAAVILLLVSGALRFFSWHHHGLWRWTHRTFQVLFLVAVCVHVIPKILPPSG
jgi:hypothetical protein